MKKSSGGDRSLLFFHATIDEQLLDRVTRMSHFITKISTPLPANSATQRSRILGLLIAARGEWVPLPEIAALACQYNSRLYELRRLGFRIENRTKEIEGSRRSWFRLISGPAETKPSSSTPAASVDADNSQTVSLDKSASFSPHAQETLAFVPSEGNS